MADQRPRALPIQTHLGRVDKVVRQEAAALSRDVKDELASIQAGWAEFESAFDSLKGRRMLALVFPREDVYRLCSERLDRDRDNPLGLDETVIPGGDYLRLRLIGKAPAVYEQIAPAFDLLLGRLAALGLDHDVDRPLIEFYKRDGLIDCLMPIH
jgi:hypothetical protein